MSRRIAPSLRLATHSTSLPNHRDSFVSDQSAMSTSNAQSNQSTRPAPSAQDDDEFTVEQPTDPFNHPRWLEEDLTEAEALLNVSLDIRKNNFRDTLSRGHLWECGTGEWNGWFHSTPATPTKAETAVSFKVDTTRKSNPQHLPNVGMVKWRKWDSWQERSRGNIHLETGWRYPKLPLQILSHAFFG